MRLRGFSWGFGAAQDIFGRTTVAALLWEALISLDLARICFGLEEGGSVSSSLPVKKTYFSVWSSKQVLLVSRMWLMVCKTVIQSALTVNSPN